MPKHLVSVVVVVVVIMVSAGAVLAAGPEWGGAWQNGPATTFGTGSWTRFDGAYYGPTGLVYFLGGRYGTNTDGSVWTYNPGTGTYADTGVDLLVPISNYTANVLTDGTGTGFYTIGGRTAAGTQTFVVQAYYPASNTAVQLPAADNYPGAVAPGGALSVVLNNKVYVAGGFDGTANSNQTWVFDPMAASGSRWTQLASANLATARSYIMGAVVDGLIYAIGGSYWDGVSALVNVATVEVLNPADAVPSWNDAAVADLPEVCSETRAWGFDTGSLYEDPSDNTSLSGTIISACGVWSTPVQSVYAYTVATNTWAAFPSLLTARRSVAGEFLPLVSAPALWLWGGYDATGVETNTVEYYSLFLTPVQLQSFSVE